MRSTWLSVVILFTACATACATSPGDQGGDDGPDGSPIAFDAGPNDAAAPDSTTPDAPLDAPLDAPKDVAPSPDAALDAGTDAPAPVTGMTWPPTQIFPTFAPPASPLDVVMTNGRAADLLTLVTTLEGVVNKTKPRIYVSDDGLSAKLWLTEMNVVTTTVADPLTLVTKYKSEVAGIVIYDDSVMDTLNLATTIAGVKGGIVASPALATTLTAAPYQLPVLADLRTNHFASKLDVYQYEYDNYATVTSHRLIIGLTPSIGDHLRDYAVATGAATVWLDPTKAAEKTMLGKFLALLSPNSPYMGWWTSEPDGVQLASTYGVPVYAADWSTNLTVLGGTPRGSTPHQVPPPPPLEKKLYVAIFMSDGDNLQEDEGLIPLKWSDKNRGNVPINWTVNPALVDVGPVMLRYFQRTSTVNDLLVSGPSGLGYTYPAAWPATMFDDYAKVSGTYMGAAGLRVATLWNNGADLSVANAQSYATRIPSLLGLTIQNSTTARQFINNTLPVERMTLSYGDNESIVESGVDTALKSFDGSTPAFAAVQGNMNMGTIDPTAFLNVQNHYASNTNVVFVRADHLFQLMSRAYAPPKHQVFTGDFNGDGKTDSLFYYASNGDWWLGASDGTKLAWSNINNSLGFGNLTDGSHAIYTGDFTGDGKADVLFFYAGDNSWWLGASSGTALSWAKINTSSVGNVLDGKHTVRIGDYDGDHKLDIAVHAADGSWSLGLCTGTSITWKSSPSTGGFGNLLDGSHVFYDGDFDGDGKADVLFFYNGDKNLWVGRSTGAAFTWSNWGNASAYGNLVDTSHRLMTGDFNGDHKTDLLFYSSGDSNWWLGLSSGTTFTWSQAGNTSGAGNFRDWNHRLQPADVDADGKMDVVSFDSASGDWVVGHSDGHALTWKPAGNTASFGDVADPTRLLWLAGDYDGDGRAEPLFYSSSNGDWSMGSSDGTTFTFHQAVNTSGFGDLTH